MQSEEQNTAEIVPEEKSCIDQFLLAVRAVNDFKKPAQK
jgi:hypothetical protein